MSVDLPSSTEPAVAKRSNSLVRERVRWPLVADIASGRPRRYGRTERRHRRMDRKDAGGDAQQRCASRRGRSEPPTEAARMRACWRGRPLEVALALTVFHRRLGGPVIGAGLAALGDAGCGDL